MNDKIMQAVMGLIMYGGDAKVVLWKLFSLQSNLILTKQKKS